MVKYSSTWLGLRLDLNVGGWCVIYLQWTMDPELGCVLSSNRQKMTFLRRVIITEKVKLLLTLYRPLPLFYLVKLKLLVLPPSPPKVSKNCTLSEALVATARLIGLACLFWNMKFYWLSFSSIWEAMGIQWPHFYWCSNEFSLSYRKNPPLHNPSPECLWRNHTRCAQYEQISTKMGHGWVCCRKALTKC